MAVRIASAESIRRAILADALLGSIIDRIDVNTTALPPIALGATGAILDLPEIDGFTAVWFIKIIGLTFDEITQVSNALHAIFPTVEVDPGISGLEAKLYTLVTDQIRQSVVEAERNREEKLRIASIEKAVSYATNLKDGLQGPKGDRGEQGVQGPQGDRGPSGLPGRDGRDLLATEAVLDDIKDVIAPNPVIGQVLMWDGSSWVSRFVPQIYRYASGGGGQVETITTLDAGDFDQ